MANRNLELLTNVAQLLKPMLGELVFLGGCTTTLFITDRAAGQVRPTYDVDVIAEITSYAGYVSFSQRLRELNFSEDQSEGAPLCRWKHGEFRLDVMPVDGKILGFSNRWYAQAMTNACEVKLSSSLRIKAVTALYFIATKLEAFKGRGGHDYFASHDLEDVMIVIDGRPELLNELQAAEKDLRTYIRVEIQHLLQQRDFLDALPGYLFPDAVSQQRLAGLLKRLHELVV